MYNNTEYYHNEKFFDFCFINFVDVCGDLGTGSMQDMEPQYGLSRSGGGASSKGSSRGSSRGSSGNTTPTSGRLMKKFRKAISEY